MKLTDPRQPGNSLPSRILAKAFKDSDGLQWQLDVFCLDCQPATAGKEFLVTYAADARLKVTSDLLSGVGFDGVRLVEMSRDMRDLKKSYSVQKKIPIGKISDIGLEFAAAVEAKLKEVLTQNWKRERLREFVQNLEFSSFRMDAGQSDHGVKL